jgi:peptidoglycan/xylan/chitin deacetylase (PgdA/CDA1 family)
MSFMRHLFLSGYYHATLPWRRRAAARAAREGRAPVTIIFYHRVADQDPSPWTISCGDFAKQIDWLQQNFDLISLAEAQQRIRSRQNSRPAIAITFDDGYFDNFHYALPLLVGRRIPVTYFVTTRHILKCEPFPHDVARGRPQRPNTIAQLRELTLQGVEIGAHTRTHADLGRLNSADELNDEVVIAGEELQSALNCTIRYFAFPYGQHANLNADAFHIAYEAGYEGVCSAYGGYNFPGDDAFHLQRFHADPNLLRLKNWLTVDPRWLRTKRFEYEQPARECSSKEAVVS